MLNKTIKVNLKKDLKANCTIYRTKNNEVISNIEAIEQNISIKGLKIASLNDLIDKANNNNDPLWTKSNNIIILGFLKLQEGTFYYNFDKEKYLQL